MSNLLNVHERQMFKGKLLKPEAASRIYHHIHLTSNPKNNNIDWKLYAKSEHLKSKTKTIKELR